MKTLINILDAITSFTTNLKNKLEKNVNTKPLNIDSNIVLPSNIKEEKILLIAAPVIEEVKEVVKDEDLLLKITATRKGQGKGNNKLIISLTNYQNLSHDALLRGIYNTLTTNRAFKNYGKHKVIMVNCDNNGLWCNFHHNVLFQENTTFEMYLDLIGGQMNYVYESDYAGYRLTNATEFEVVVYKIDRFADSIITMNKPENNQYLSVRSTGIRIEKKNTRGYSTLNNLLPPVNDTSLIEKDEMVKAEELKNKEEKIVKPNNSTHFMPLNGLENLSKANVATLDCETIVYNKLELTWLVTFVREDGIEKYFIIDRDLFFLNPEEAVTSLWIDVFNYLTLYHKGNVLVHNLGAFDGYFIYKYASILFGPTYVNSLIDPQNRFITIDITFEDPEITDSTELKFNKIKFKDSMRQFPIGLDDFCKIYNVDGKLSKFNKDWHDVSILYNQNSLIEAIKYGIQDSKCLLQAYIEARNSIYRDYSVDTLSIVSTPSLAIKIWQTNFLDFPIPILSNNLDRFIRPSYYGGATDYYKAYDENVKYYDVNSLYPSVMAKYEYPYEFIKLHKDINPNEIDNLFGFVDVVIEIPKDTLKPFLPYKYEERTIFPTGILRGIYFTEEIKAVLKYNPGSKILFIHKYLEFSKCRPFYAYINHMYALKKEAVGAPRFMAKLLQNSLYGFFGRMPILNEFKNVWNYEIPIYLVSRIVNNIIEINNEVSAINMSCNMNSNNNRSIYSN